MDFYLTALQIHEHADKQSQECSGGTKRKLSFAMAMIGGPKVVLMDEPSAGMDPKSKRFLWDTILASFQVCLYETSFSKTHAQLLRIVLSLIKSFSTGW